MKIIKAHCIRHNKWFRISVNDREQIDNFENMSEMAAKACQTQAKGTSFQVSSELRPCMKCGSRKAGCCSHVADWGLCSQEYFYQCLFCDQLRISLESADSRYSSYVGISNIVGAKLDRHGNPLGAQYDLAKDNGFKGYRIVILAVNSYYKKNVMTGPIKALESKGFTVTHISYVEQPVFLDDLLKEKTQLWIISDSNVHFGQNELQMLKNFYQRGGGLYLWGDNDPLHADADRIGKYLFDVSMKGDYIAEKTIGIKQKDSKGGIIPGHPISTGIVRFYEGVTIAAVQTNKTVRPLVYSSDGNVVTAFVDEGGKRCLIDGGFTRLLDSKWDSAGTGRFVVNCAAWLANAESETELRFT